MKKRILPVLIGGCLFLSGCWQDKTQPQTEQTEEIIIVAEPTEQEVAQELQESEQAEEDQFKILQLEELLDGKSGSQALQDLVSQGNVIVDFYATWCPPCQAMHPIVDKLAEAFHPHAKIIKVDIDKFKNVADKFEVDNQLLSVKSIPQFYFFKNGKLVEQYNGDATYEAFKEKIEKIINLQ